MYFILTLYVILISIPLCFTSAQLETQQLPMPDYELNDEIRNEVINNLIAELNDSYIFTETASMMEKDLQRRLKNKEYDHLISPDKFADKLTQDLLLISNDKHLRVIYSATALPLQDKNEPNLEEKAKFALFVKKMNFGFAKVEWMEGNIGYIDLRGFLDPLEGAETVNAAMTFISNTNALIFDLRQNGGGDPAMVALISSYLFGDKPIHLNDLYWRKENKTEEFWTTPDLAIKKFDKDIYILIGSNTFSAGEEFTYNLKNLGRATLIGETTRGGAHPGGMTRLSDHFTSFIPEGRAINPITKTNWEGTGVKPDIEVPEEEALKIAYIMALTKSLNTAANEDIKEIKTLIEQIQKELTDIKKSDK